MKQTFKFLTVFLLALLGASNLWATDYYYRGNGNSYGATPMTQSDDGLYWYISVKGHDELGANQMFKIATSTTSWDYGKDNLNAKFDGTDIDNMGGWDTDGNACIYNAADFYVLFYPKMYSFNTDKEYICANTTKPTKKHDWYIKSSFGGGDWTWNKMTTPSSGSAYTYDALWGDNGCNINTANKDDKSGWIAKESISDYNGLTTSDRVRYTYNPKTNQLSVQKLITITYGGNLSVTPNMSSGTEIISGSQELVFTAADRTGEGYSFVGFFKDGSKTQEITGTGVNVANRTYTVTPTANLEVHAKYTPIQYTITYNVNGGSEIAEHLTYNVETSTFSLPIPTKSNYAFRGWYTNEGCTEGKTEQIAKGTIGNKIFYAKWKQEGLYLNMNWGSDNWEMFLFDTNDGKSITKVFDKNQTYTFSIGKVKHGQDDQWFKKNETWTKDANTKSLNTTDSDGRFSTHPNISGELTFTVNSTTNPTQLTITYPSFSNTFTIENYIVPNEAFSVTINPSVVGFTPTYKLYAQKDGGDWTEVGQINANTYSFTPDGAGNYKFKVRAYANETDYLESAESNVVRVAGLTVEASDENPSKGALVQLTPIPSSNLTTDDYNLSYAFTQKPDGSTAELSLNAGKIEFTGDIPGTYKVQVTLKDKQDTRALATSIVTINYVDEYWIYFKKTVADWGDNVYLYFEVTWNGTYGARADVAPIVMTQMGETDVYGVKVPQEYENMDYIAFCNTSVAKNAYLTGKAVYRGDYNKTFNMFVPSTISNESKSATYYSNGRWFKYDTDKGYKLVVGGNETALTFASEASLTPNSIELSMTANQELSFTLTNPAQSTTFYLPSILEISNCTNLKMTDVANGNKFLTAVAGTYTVSIDFDENNPYVEPTISVVYPTVPAPSVTFAEQRYKGDDEMQTFISGDGTTEESPYTFFMDEKMKLTISEMPEVKGLTAYYKFGNAAAGATRTLNIIPEDNDVHSITMEAYYEKGTVKTASTTKTIYYQALNVPAVILTSNLSNDEVNYDEWSTANPQIHYAAENYTGSFSITKDGADWHSESGTPHNYTIEDPTHPAFIAFHASFIYGSREFTKDLTITAYRNVVYKVKDGSGFTGNKVYMWCDGTDPTVKNAEWPGEDFISNFGNWHIFNLKYPIYNRWIINDGQNNNNHQTNNQEVDGNSSDICLKIADSGTKGTGNNDGKTLYNVSSAECPGHILVDAVGNQTVTKNTSKLVVPNVHIMLGVSEQEITMEVRANNDNVTVLQSGMSVLVTGMKVGNSNVTIDYYYHKDQGDQEKVSTTFAVTITQPEITIRANIAINLGWRTKDGDKIWLKYWDDKDDSYSDEHNVKMTKDKWNETTQRDEYYATFTFPDGVDAIKFQVGDPNGESWSDEWRKTWLITGVTSSSCYNVSYSGTTDSREIVAVDCGDSEYQIVINMNSGDEYKSNKVTSADATLSFFAPGASETGYKAGLVRLFNKDEQLAIIPASTFAASGVYTAKINDTYNGLEDVDLYEGDYYIRTDAATTTASGDDFSDGWNNYKNEKHKFTKFSLYEGASYDYYWVTNCKRENSSHNLNIKARVANEYNDNLANMIESSNYTDGGGFVPQNTQTGLNIRFGYNPATNYFERAVLTGSTEDGNKFLNVVGVKVYEDQACQHELTAANYDGNPLWTKFNDASDWIYEKLVFVKIEGAQTSSTVELRSLVNGQVLYQLGYEIDEFGRQTSTPKKQTIMGFGSTENTYALRLIYDFKINRLVSAWSPVGNFVVTGDMKVDADILFIRKEDRGVGQVTFSNKSASVTSLQSIIGVLELDAPVGDENERTYWVSVPYQVRVGDIFGMERYVTLDDEGEAIDGSWGLLRYDGETRSKKGWFIEDTPEGFWKWLDKDYILQPGIGYALVVDKKDYSWNTFTQDVPCEGGEGCVDGKKTETVSIKRIYFPSLTKNFVMQNSEVPVEYPDQPCTITSPKDRRAEDSNWKVIAPASYNDIKADVPEYTGPHSNTYEGGWPSFIYLYDESKKGSSSYVPTSSVDFTYQAFHSYMVQYAGTITWKDATKTQASAPRFAEEPEFKGGTMTIELVQNNEQLDRTFVKLSKNGTTGFDQNLDLTKITENCAQIASVSEDVLYAGNTLPLDIEMVPLNVKVVANGTYDIALVQSLEGLEVRLYDAFEQTTTPLDLMSATVTLDKGEYKDRFFLQFVQKSPLTPTNLNGAIEQFNLPTDKTQKLLINDNIYLINGGRIYNVLGVGE